MFLFVMFIIGLVVAAIIMRAWVTTILWSWFIVPVFHVPELTLPMAMGISLVIGMFITMQATKDIDIKSGKEAVFQKVFEKSFLEPLVTLGVGWIITLFL